MLFCYRKHRVHEGHQRSAHHVGVVQRVQVGDGDRLQAAACCCALLPQCGHHIQLSGCVSEEEEDAGPKQGVFLFLYFSLAC